MILGESMDYKVFYRKYRPDSFDDLVGQEHIKRILKNSVINNKIAHAYIFTGPRGTGKTSTAKIFAKTINCEQSIDGIACGKCSSCINFKTSPDIIEIDAASNNGVDNIRDIIENVGIAPTNSKYKIYIIDEVHMLSQQAWNAFLKTLEEPPKNVIFILATTDIQKVPITVLSRCQRFDFQRIDKNLIVDRLSYICTEEQIPFEVSALEEISYLSDGCLRDALSILDQLSKLSEKITFDVVRDNYGTIDNNDIDRIYTAILHNNIDDLVTIINSIKQSGIDIKVLIDKMTDNFIDKAINMKKKNVSNNAFKQLKKIIESLNLLLTKLNSNSNGYLLLELELISFINDENNQISNREISQIISREIISGDKNNVNIESLIDNNNKNGKYRICDEFINIRINNSFYKANKKIKNDILAKWKEFSDHIINDNVKEFLTVVRNSNPQVVSSTNILFITSNESTKVVANSKLDDLEKIYNKMFATDYKMVFITNKEWQKVFDDYSSNKDKYKEYIDDEQFKTDMSDSLKLAEDIFGSDNINIE